MKPREYEVLCMAVEAGVARGFRRAWKHLDEPEPKSAMQEPVAAEVITAICEWFILANDGAHDERA